MNSGGSDPVVDRLRRLIEAKRGKEALAEIERLPEDMRNHTHILRLKSFAYGFPGGDINEVYALSRTLATREDNSIGDLYWVGQRAAEFCDYKDAEAFLTSAIDRSKGEGNSYYLNCALLLRAYVRCHLRKFAAAKEDIEEVAEDDTEIFWSDRLGHISKENLLHYLSGSHSPPSSADAPCSCRKGKGSNSERD
jgi:hypothetical protein